MPCCPQPVTELDSSGRHVWPGSAHPTAVTVQESLADGPHDLFLQLPEVMTRHTPSDLGEPGESSFFLRERRLLRRRPLVVALEK